jgi:bifunctional ADP-heptose synthase (sugar kinase/adenylyltransferase)
MLLKGKNRPKILVVGESCTDIFIYGATTRLCPEAPAPVFRPFKTIVNGGMAHNVYKNLSFMGATADLYTNDNWEEITKTRYVDDNMNYMLLRVDRNDDKYGIADIRELKLEEYDAVLISDYNKGFLSTDDVKYICENHKDVFMDTKKRLGSWCSKAKYIKINNNEFELTKSTLTKDLEERLIVTQGKDGCTHKGISYPVKEVQIKDSSGAGDTFISAFAIKFVETRDVQVSITYANDCATRVVQKRGTSTV